MKNENILEEEVKNSVAATYFSNFNCTKILGKVDFAVAPLSPSKGGGTTPSPFGEGAGGEVEYLLWAEAKQKPTDLFAMFAQLILTIGKARTFDKIMPPKFLGAFDSEKIAFVPYYEIQELFYLNDFNWNVTPSNTATKEFQLIKTKVEKSVVGRHCGLDPQSPENAGDSCFRRNDEMLTFYFEKDEKELRRFIKENFVVGKGDVTKIEITENNVVHIFHKWVEKVKPTIAIKWKEEAYDYKIYERDFFLADLISENNETFENLTVKLRKDYYKTEVDVKRRLFLEIEFTDGGKAYREFWAKYARPPREIYRNRIRERADLLVLPSFRERAGAFFTPQIWVEKAQEYLADEFGENWQDEYYIWDCAAGTGNLLQGLTKPNRVFASTLDNGDVKIMHDDIEQKRSPLLKDHVFQFDFLNDSFENLPETLLNIIKDEKRRKNLIIYINPPYVEVSSIKGGKKGANQSKIHDKYLKELGTAGREMYTQFFMRICKEIPDSKLAAFSKMKHISGSAFESFRNNFLAEYKKGFICLANFFDNVAGNFPIGFQIWDLSKKIHFKKVKVDIFDNNGQNIGTHHFYAYTNANYINEWISKYNKKPNGEYLGFLAGTNGNGVQHNRIVYIINKKEQMPNPRGIYITVENLIESSVYLAIRKVIKQTWINDRDQFLYPNQKWEKDTEFHNDCLAYAIFSNNISSKQGVNHWIPFEESEINARTLYDSHILLGFLQGKKIQNAYTDLFEQQEQKLIKREFSPEAQAVFDAGREIWKYYHSQDIKFFEFNFAREKYNVNASLYDIKWYFKGFTTDKQGKERMNNKSDNEDFNILENNLSKALKNLAAKIEPKVYEYEFLME